MDAVAALGELGGVATTVEMLTRIDRRELTRAEADGEIERLVRGRYALPGLDAARAAAHRLDASISHLSAAQHWGWKVRRPAPRPSVTVPRSRNLSADRRRGVDLHYADLRETEIVDGVTTRVRTVLDCARDLTLDESLSVADSALRDGRVTKEQLRAGADLLPRTGRSAALRVVAAASAKAANPFESVLRSIALGVPGLSVEPQVVVGHVDRIGAADLVDVERRIVAEAESWEHHGERDAFNYDIRRYTEMVRGGWRVVRFTYDDVMHRAAYVHETFADLVRAT